MNAADPGHPLVSVIIPCFNGERWLGEAIGSAVSQTHRNVEVIVVDDGSSDDSLTVAGGFGVAIRVERQERRGASAARNRGLALARGDYVKFLDADDVLVPDCLAWQVDDMSRHRGTLTAVFGKVTLIDEDGAAKGDYPAPEKEGDVSLEWVVEHSIITASPLFRRADLEGHAYDETLTRGQEYDFHVRLAIGGMTFRYRARTVYNYRQHRMGHRLSEQKFAATAGSRLATTLTHIRLVEDRQGSPLPLSLRRAFAHHFWDLGREALRAGEGQAAREFFWKARRICPESPTSGRLRYRLISGLTTPAVAERMGAVWIRLRPGRDRN